MAQLVLFATLKSNVLPALTTVEETFTGIDEERFDPFPN
jgi:hypothetical protein